MAAWFLTTFCGSLSAGLVGMLWGEMAPVPFFAMLAGIAVAALLLRSLNEAVSRVDPTRI